MFRTLACQSVRPTDRSSARPSVRPSVARRPSHVVTRPSIVGRYAPSEAHLLHAGEGVYSDHGSAQTWFDPLAPDFDRFPRAKQATAWLATLEEGDTILIPADWFHYAIALTPSITVRGRPRPSVRPTDRPSVRPSVRPTDRPTDRPPPSCGS